MFVAIDADLSKAPKSFIVPRDHVVAAAHIVHMAWLTDPSVQSGKRNVGIEKARVSLRGWAGYEDRWDLLDTSAELAPVLLRPELRELAMEERVGLPSHHPWTRRLPTWYPLPDLRSIAMRVVAIDFLLIDPQCPRPVVVCMGT